jgi:DNA-binding response OmpR family regulator
MNVMIVDSAGEFSDLLSHYLKDYCKFEVVSTCKVDEAFEVFERSKPELVIIDLPHDGEECLEFVRKVRKFYPSSPKIIIMSTSKNVVDRVKSMSLINIIMKPFNIDELDQLMCPDRD